MKKILVTGFEPFHTHKINPSSELAKKISEEAFVEDLILPVSYQRSKDLLFRRIADAHYDFVLMLGLAADRECIYLEKVALNLMDSQIADSDQVLAQEAPIRIEGPSAYINPLPLKKWCENSTMKVSYSAGAYVCNHLYYSMCDLKPKTPSLFVHVPQLSRPEEMLSAIQELKKLLIKIRD